MKLGLNSFLWILAFLLLGGSVIYFFLTVGNLDYSVPAASKVSSTASAPGVTPSSYIGTIVKIDQYAGNPGTHRLMDDSGNISAYLESRSIDLRILEGSKVVIEGKRERMVGSGVPLIAVDKVNFN